MTAADVADLLPDEAVVLAGRAGSRDEAIEEAGRLLVGVGAVESSYVDAMLEREQSVSTAMGAGLAIPHGTNEAKGSIHRTALSFVRHAAPVDWSGHPVEFVVGVAGVGDDHLELLGKLAEVFTDPDQVDRLRAATSAEEVRAALGG
ncbi:PTS sugar transporter subunit IIA [Nocardioides sp. HDW12B]|uniref:PTS sugar transporter subunit IIA n=1 Tax=Nocardioides sp. HDW12B TaxID=2714939 RepID=UPI003211E45A